MSRTITFTFLAGESNTNIYNLNIGRVKNFQLKSFYIKGKVGTNLVFAVFNNPTWFNKRSLCLNDSKVRYQSLLLDGVNRRDNHKSENWEDDNYVSHFDLDLYELDGTLSFSPFTGHDLAVLEFEYDECY